MSGILESKVASERLFEFKFFTVKKYIVRFAPDERDHLLPMMRGGKAAARTLLPACVLLKADQGLETTAWSDEAIGTALEVHTTTVARVRQHFVEPGLEAALRPPPTTRQYARKRDGVAEAHLIALACGPAPAGRAQWTLRW
jgi:hypothetical protein